ncbi:hypothetical protein ABZ958_28540 [Streptomyces sp. NPDC046237]|uniref:hypothetical protein n=1 Tax=Streptomyces sp. NPDC046237 TaxID=3154914 RepID=UPI0033D82AF4
MEAFATRKEPSPSEVKIHASRAAPEPAGSEVVADPPETWASTRPPPEAMR